MKMLLFMFLALPIFAMGQTKYIPGIEPVDVYLNLEDIGFTTEKDLGSRFGNFWTSTNSSNGISYRVEISSKDVNRVQSIKGTAMNFNLNKPEARRFLKYLASVLFLDGQNGKIKAESWIDRNFDNDGATTSVRGTSIKISAPSGIIRSITIDSDLADGM